MNLEFCSPEFQALIERYFPQKSDEVLSMIGLLRCWRTKEDFGPLMEACIKQWVAEFKERILAAVHDGDTEYIANLLEAMQPDSLSAVQAALLAAESISPPLPTKAAVKRQARKLLAEKGCPLPPANHWPRILADAGLKDLPKERPGRPRKK